MCIRDSRKLFQDEDRAFAVDVPISPEQLVTDHVASLIEYPGALQVLDFADGRVRLVGVKGLRGGALVGQQLKQLATHIKGRDARVAAIYRNGQSIKPTGCLLYTSDAADERSSVDLGGRRI